jgi:ethanolamine utilization protein EutP (predicted NTPase)
MVQQPEYEQGMTVSQPGEFMQRKRVFGVFSIISGVLSILLLVGNLLTPPPSSPTQLLSFITNNSAILILGAVLILAKANMTIIIRTITLFKVKGPK